MAKARAGFHGPAGLGINQILRGTGGPEYIASLLIGFTGEEKEEAGVTLYENSANGGYVAMNPVLYGDDVTYADGTEATPEQIAQDVAAFLMWTAEPKMMARKQAGLTAVLFLVGADGAALLHQQEDLGAAQGQARRHPRLTPAPCSPPPRAIASPACSRSCSGASTTPALVETEDGTRWAMKFGGAGRGPTAC